MRKIKTLKMNYEFKNVFERGKYYPNSQITIYVLKNKKGYNRIGIAVGTKVGKAVKRNHIKRLIRSAYQTFELENQSLDIVFTWNKKNDAEEADFHKIKNNMEKAFLKIGIIK